jgi:hypothetical protein
MIYSLFSFSYEFSLVCTFASMSKWRRGGLSSVYAKKKDNGFAVFLNDKPKKYKYNPIL